MKYSDSDIKLWSDDEFELDDLLDNRKIDELKRTKNKRLLEYKRTKSKELKESEKKRLEQIVDKRREEEKVQREIQLEEEKLKKEKIDNAIPSKNLSYTFKENEVRANELLRHKLIVVKGELKSVQEIDELIIIDLEGDDLFSTVSCVTDNRSYASKLRRGDKVVIEGMCRGMDDVIKTSVTITHSDIIAVFR